LERSKHDARGHHTINLETALTGFITALQITQLRDALAEMGWYAYRSQLDPSLAETIHNAVSIHDDLLIGQFQPVEVERLHNLRRTRKTPVLLLTHWDLAAVPNYATTRTFEQQFARFFGLYRNAQTRNNLARLRESSGELNTGASSHYDFIEQYGSPPWDAVNDKLEQAGLRFQFTAPARDSYDNYAPQIVEDGTERGTYDMSSGEKVITALALLSYRISDPRQPIEKPDIVLLDEVDGPLHPKMCQNLLNVVQKVFIEDLNVPVIMVTHSPTTVALFPSEEVYMMDAALPQRLQPVDKDRAVRMLTAGVPTLSLSWDGRRQVLCESAGDAKLYTILYQSLEDHLPAELSLEFIATSVDVGTVIKDEASGQEIHAGAPVVLHLVRTMRPLGVRSIFGLTDADGHYKSSDGVVVLAEKTRYSVENTVLDPLTLLAFMIHDHGDALGALGMAARPSTISFLAMNEQELQPWVDLLQEQVLGPLQPGEVTRSCKYVGGLTLDIRQAWLGAQGHDLAEKILDQHNLRKKFADGGRGAGAHMRFMQKVATTVGREFPEMFALELVSALQDLLAQH
jgi:energy-coupling factor transporter ATP-binding protein EcfA2